MVALEVTRNGRRLCVAGIGDEGVVSAHVHWNGRPGRAAHPQLAVGGLHGDSNVHVTWVERAIRVGDVVTIRVVEVPDADPPPTRRQGLPVPGKPAPPNRPRRRASRRHSEPFSRPPSQVKTNE
jgi:hypothetical protein